MNKKEPSELTNEELIAEASKIKSASIINAVLIGFLIGIVSYSTISNSLGLLTLIPLAIAYRLIKKPDYRRDEIIYQMKSRNLN